MFDWLRKFFGIGIGDSMATITGYRRPLGYQQIDSTTLGAGAVNLTLPTLTGPLAGLTPGYAVIQCNGGTVRWRDDGVDPTATIGMTIPANGELDYCGDLNKLKLILSTSTPTVDVSIYA